MTSNLDALDALDINGGDSAMRSFTSTSSMTKKKKGFAALFKRSPKSTGGEAAAKKDADVSILAAMKENTSATGDFPRSVTDSINLAAEEEELEAARCRHDYPIVDGALSQEAAAKVMSGMVDSGPGAGSISGIRVLLKRGEDLYPADSSGLSDPFVILKIDKFSKHKSKVVSKTLNPEWSEDVFLPCPENCLFPLNVECRDHDRFGTDYIGSGDIDIANLKLNEPRDVKLKLKDTRDTTKKLPADLGFIYLTVTRVHELTKKEREKRKKAQATGSRLITVDLIEARDLVAMDDNGLADPYVKIELGKDRRRSKVVNKTLSPKFKQRFEFQVHDQTQLLTLWMYDRDVGGTDQLMGKTEIDLSSIPYDLPKIGWYHLGDPKDSIGEIHVQVTVSDLYSDSKSGTLSIEDRERFCGNLMVHVIKARNLDAKDIGGKSDPYVIVELGNSRLRTTTQKQTLNPTWDRKMEFAVKDIFESLSIGVWDEDAGGRSQFLGALEIPLLEMQNGVSEWYALKNKTLMKRYKGDILLSFELHWKTIPGIKSLISPREVKFMADEEKFKTSLLVRNINRLKALIFFVVGLIETQDGLFAWRYGFFKSFTAMICWIVGCLYMEMYHVPLLILLYLFKQYLFNFRGRKVVDAGDGIEIVEYDDSEEEEEEEDDDSGKSKERQGFREKMKALNTVAQTVQIQIGNVASLGEQVKNLFNWSVPAITYVICIAMIIGAVALYFIPLRYILLAWGTKKFIKKGLNHYHPFGFFKLPKHHVNVTEPLELLGRVPSDIDRQKRKKLQPKGSRSLRSVVSSRVATDEKTE